MPAEDTRTFKMYQVVGSVEVADSRTGLFCSPGEMVELSADPQVIFQGGQRIELAGTNIDALLEAGFIAEVPAAPAKAEKKA